MPQYAPDLDLRDTALRYATEVHGSVKKRAAKALGLDYGMFRRFLKGGSASPEHRQSIRNALERAGYEIAKKHNIAHEIPVDVTRSMLTQLLQALDAYQGTAAAGQSN
ncbi:hypothetical protein [Sphingomonas sp. UNC305MFCol5.2]|uniref:hypothetical protein n=1 Tax=Sphingomonas sp. UNC305MFCol5.2 TaxID=1449076 RepID=UPI000424CE67|nr:hypothetical protein [Sphingomonas sp. UNC305MFCol5.2]